MIKTKSSYSPYEEKLSSYESELSRFHPPLFHTGKKSFALHLEKRKILKRQSSLSKLLENYSSVVEAVHSAKEQAISVKNQTP